MAPVGSTFSPKHDPIARPEQRALSRWNISSTYLFSAGMEQLCTVFAIARTIFVEDIRKLFALRYCCNEGTSPAWSSTFYRVILCSHFQQNTLLLFFLTTFSSGA